VTPLHARWNALLFIRHARTVADNPLFNFAFLFSLVSIMNKSVPRYNELIYLPALLKRWNPRYLLNDWTFSERSAAHDVFNLLFGFPTLLFPLEIVGWIGRVVCWSLLIMALLQLGQLLRIPRWCITLSIVLWLLVRQSVFGHERILGPFEAKSVAYVMLLFSITGFLKNRLVFPSVLLGLSVSFHPVVGVWGGLAIGLSLMVCRYPFHRLVNIGCYAFLFALPGLMLMFPVVFQMSARSSDDWRFISLVVLPSDFDPLSFPNEKLLLLCVLLTFNWLYFRQKRGDQSIRFLMAFQGFLGVLFSLGVFSRLTENIHLLKLMPGRLFPVFVALFFFFNLMHAFHHRSSLRIQAGLLALAMLAFLPPETSLARPVQRPGDRHWAYTHNDDDLRRSFTWISENTLNGSVAILPPWKKDSFYYSKRAQVASWHAVRVDRPGEWRTRMESMVGDVAKATGSGRTKYERMEHHYHHLTEADVFSISEQYGAEYFVSGQAYPYPVLFDSPTYKVYLLRRNVPSSTNGPQAPHDRDS